jgi:ketosteroid isomerase-like protein
VPSDDAYSRVSDPERYRPLHRRAELLAQRLTSVFDVQPNEETSKDGGRVVRLVPADPAAAPITIEWTDFPGLIVRFGDDVEVPFPRCGCDACDEDVDELFAGLERDVYAVTHGRFREWQGGHEFDYPGGSSGSGERSGEPRAWRAWPRGDTDALAAVFAFVVPPRVPAEQVVREHLAAFNAHDTLRLLAWCTPDCVWVTGTDRFEGRPALAGIFDDWLWSLEPTLTVESMIAEGDSVAAELTERVTVDGETRSFAIAAFFTVADGLISRAKVYREGNADLDSKDAGR